jgi:DNA-binding response OmpR family regulator
MAEPQKTSLLIVDDDPAIRKLLARIAQREGFVVETARDGIDALEKLESKSFQIAIVDLMMPRLSGYELVQKINAIVPRPIIIVATALTNGDVATLDDSLVRRVIRKPFDINAVAKALVDTARQLVTESGPDVVQFNGATGEVTPPLDLDTDPPKTPC